MQGPIERLRPAVNRSRTSRNLTRSIVETLGQSIVAGAYDARAPFPIEAELCAQFGASRTSVREAVKMLTAKGLLSARPRRGTAVEPEAHWNLLDPDVLRWLLERQFSPRLLTEFTQVRLAIEPMAASLAASRNDAAAIAPISAAIARMQAAERGEDDPLDSDIAFHVAVLHASGNRFYAQLHELIDTALRFSIRVTNEFKGVAVGNVADHKRVLDAIEAGDPDAARDAMRAILVEVRDLIDASHAT